MPRVLFPHTPEAPSQPAHPSLKKTDTAPAEAWAPLIRHGYFWLAVANLVGLWLASLLLWPDLNELTAPFTYGRWVPLHLDWQLYGWCVLPLVVVLARWFSLGLPHHASSGPLRWSAWAWSAALLLGGGSWLAGHVSGKLFLDWSGPLRAALPVAMIVLWIAFALLAWRGRLDRGRRGNSVCIAILVTLAPVPLVFLWSTSPTVFPSVNPDSGGATGASLLGSTLGIISLYGVLPPFLGLARTRTGPLVRPAAGALACSWIVFAFAGHGHASHHLFSQVLSLALLILWVPLAAVYLRSWNWPPAARPWVIAAFAWWCTLVLSGWLTFLPEASETLKFTHGLVAHAHVAMAGLVSSVNLAVHQLVQPRPAVATRFWSWQLACIAHVLALVALTFVECTDHGAFFLGSDSTTVFLGLRWLAGAAMAWISLRWALAQH